jgi:hypothetical protein
MSDKCQLPTSDVWQIDKKPTGFMSYGFATADSGPVLASFPRAASRAPSASDQKTRTRQRKKPGVSVHENMAKTGQTTPAGTTSGGRYDLNPRQRWKLRRIT